MTHEEARNYILANYFDGDEDVRAVVGGDEEHLAMKCAVEALEKQIPKKPHDIMSCANINYGECECGEVILKNKKYCPNCGQALDWSDTDEN